MTERIFAWNPKKDALLRRARGIGFADVVDAVHEGRVLADVPNPNPKFPGQNRLVVEIDGYAIAVPYVAGASQIFLKTLFPDRKARKRFLGPKRK